MPNKLENNLCHCWSSTEVILESNHCLLQTVWHPVQWIHCQWQLIVKKFDCVSFCFLYLHSRWIVNMIIYLCVKLSMGLILRTLDIQQCPVDMSASENECVTECSVSVRFYVTVFSNNDITILKYLNIVLGCARFAEILVSARYCEVCAR